MFPIPCAIVERSRSFIFLSNAIMLVFFGLYLCNKVYIPVARTISEWILVVRESTQLQLNLTSLLLAGICGRIAIRLFVKGEVMIPKMPTRLLCSTLTGVEKSSVCFLNPGHQRKGVPFGKHVWEILLSSTLMVRLVYMMIVPV